MIPLVTGFVVGALVLLVAGLALFLWWGSNWGATSDEQAAAMPGDAYLEGKPRARVAMTRAVSVRARPEVVWPWLAQLGRGAGWYSVDRLDNGGKASARHIVSWIPEPREGDAAAIGYLRRIDPGRGLTWWLKELGFVGAHVRLVVDIDLRPEGDGSRLVTRMSGDASGATAALALLVFRFMDSVMAVRQILGIRERVERYGARAENTQDPETGAKDQYQLYEIIYASGERAGVPGKERGPEWRQSAIDDGILPAP
jgi:hypothetical protein